MTSVARNVYDAIEYCCAGMGFNQVASRMRRDMGIQGEIASRLQDMGQNRLIPLTTSYAEARVALAFYAGDGIVTKIVPNDFHDRSTAIHNLPPITSQKVSDPLYDYVIDTYPWVDKGNINAHEVEDLRTRMGDVGLYFNNEFGNSRNIHRMPDKQHTLIGIDSGMYISAGNDNQMTPELAEAWQAYLESVFPIYKSREIPVQSADTNFDFVSIHDPNSGVIGFNHRLSDPILRAPQAEEKPKNEQAHGLWDRFMSAFHHEPG